VDPRVVEPLEGDGIEWVTTLLDRGTPVQNAEVEVANSISGARTSFEHGGETNAVGRVIFQSDGAEAGYYSIRAR